MNDDECVCGHGPSVHVQGLGCVAGWEWDAEGLSTTEGCECHWVHISSPTEDVWARASKATS